MVPEYVHREVYLRGRERVKPRWIKVRSITTVGTLKRIEEFRNNYFLDRGESEAIALSEEIQVAVLLDERNARSICRELDIAHVSAYEVANTLKRSGSISAKTLARIIAALRFHGGFIPGPDDDVEIAQ